jgi:hypothetical protein
MQALAALVWHPNPFNADQTETADATDDETRFIYDPFLIGSFRLIRDT